MMFTGPEETFWTMDAAFRCSAPLLLVASKPMRSFKAAFTSGASFPSEKPTTAVSMSWNSRSP